MRKLLTLFFLAALALTLGQAALAQDADQARKDKIMANLKHKFPQLEKATIVMGEITASAYGNLDEGSFTMNGRPQKFLVSSDDTALYMISEPIDVSMGTQELAQVCRSSTSAAGACAATVSTTTSACRSAR